MTTTEPKPPTTWSPERITAVPGRSAAAFVVPHDRGGADEVSGVWYGLLDEEPQRFHSAVPATNVVASPDGSTLAFALHQEAGSQLLLVPVPGDVAESSAAAAACNGVPQAREVELQGFAEALAWTDAGLFVLSADLDADTASLTSGKPHHGAETDPLVVTDARGWRRLWRTDANVSSAPVEVTPQGITVWEFAPLADGGAIAVCSDDPSENGWYRSYIARLGADPAEPVEIIHRSDWQLSSPAVDPTGRRAAWVEGWASDRGLLAGEIQTVKLDDPSAPPRKVALAVDVTALDWDAAGQLRFAGWQGLGTSWGWISQDQLNSDDPSIAIRHETAECLNSRWHPQVVELAGGSVLTVRSDLESPPEVVRLTAGAPPRMWSRLNSGAATARSFTTRQVSWMAADGTEIQGLLSLPNAATTPPPLVVDIHGGPSVTYHHAWKLGWPEVLCQDGLAVLMPNPRGGVGRGQAFSRGNHRDPGGIELDDVIAGVRHCAEQGLVDGGRVGAIGASYGGYLTAWAICRPDVFCCGVVIAGVTDLVSCRGTANNPAFYDFLLQGTPSTMGLLYLERSPVLAVSEGSAPALIVHGLEDSCVPVSQAYELHHALCESDIETQLVIYPREGHQITEPEHLRDRDMRVRAWFRRHLG